MNQITIIINFHPVNTVEIFFPFLYQSQKCGHRMKLRFIYIPTILPGKHFLLHALRNSRTIVTEVINAFTAFESRFNGFHRKRRLSSQNFSQFVFSQRDKEIFTQFFPDTLSECHALASEPQKKDKQSISVSRIFYFHWFFYLNLMHLNPALKSINSKASQLLGRHVSGKAMRRNNRINAFLYKLFHKNVTGCAKNKNNIYKEPCYHSISLLGKLWWSHPSPVTYPDET